MNGFIARDEEHIRLVFLRCVRMYELAKLITKFAQGFSEISRSR